MTTTSLSADQRCQSLLGLPGSLLPLFDGFLLRRLPFLSCVPPPEHIVNGVDISFALA